VLPEFIERDPAAVAAKAVRMQPIVDAAMARKRTASIEAGRGPHDIGDYTFGAIPRQWAEATHDQNIEQWLEKFADDRAAGRRDESAGIAG
jgi:alpha-beta hydrolase superfamily lysophospholipase